MNLKDPEKEFFDDFEHKVTDKIKKYGDRSNFPKLEDYGIERMELEDYLFDKQAIMDMGGTPRHKMTVGGIITLIPIIILSAMPDSAYVYGMTLCFYAVLKAIIQMRLSKHKDPKFETYIKAVLFYQPTE